MARPPDNRESVGLGRGAAIAEVVAVFAIVHVAYRAFKHFTALGIAETGAGLNYSAGATMLLASVLLIRVPRRDRGAYGLNAGWCGWRGSVNLGLLWGVLLVVGAALLVKVGGLNPNPHRSPPPALAIVATVGFLAVTAIMLVTTRAERASRPRVSAFVSVPILVLVLATPVLAAMYSHGSVLKAGAAVGWLAFGAGLGEETFFRGYAQSRVDEAFGRPFCLLGTWFGPGLLVSSVLFGVIHAINTVDYFAGSGEPAWAWGLMNVGAGIFFGFMRERTGSVLPGAVAHGVSAVLQEVPVFLRAP